MNITMLEYANDNKNQFIIQLFMTTKISSLSINYATSITRIA